MVQYRCISTHSAREDGDGLSPIPCTTVVISTHSAREDGDSTGENGLSVARDFNPLRPRGRRRYLEKKENWLIYFNPLRPRGRRQAPCCISCCIFPFQPTPPARTETDRYANSTYTVKISTHSAREDGDGSFDPGGCSIDNFNPLRPRGRRLIYPIIQNAES